ncbi:MAG: transcription termination/antitermination protein NusA [Flavobacteriales bacterium]|nr:transcription termination/antitermination protein NusA [Flavobacteriales bacterium]
MSTVNLIESFGEFKDLKNIDRVTMMGILEDVFRGVVKRRFGEEANVDIIINPDKGDLEIWLNRIIVEDGMSEDDNLEIELAEAKKIEPDFEVGEEVSQEVKIADFGRRNILSLKQNLQSRIMDLEKDHLYNKYKERVGEIVTGEVYQIWKRETLILDDEGNELIMPKEQQIKTDFFKKGDSVRAVLWKVELRNNTPTVILSRTAPEFLEKLFEQEVPEVADGLIMIKRIVREPGERAKVAVESYDDRVDPVGACVGMKGSRIHGIVRELRNENIDVINYTANDELLIQRALSPAKVGNIKLDHERKRAEVYMKPDQVALAIGKGGHNIKLAGKLTGFEIDVYRETDEVTDDVSLEEFRDEIDQWIIDEFKKIGCDTARSVLDIPVDELVQRTDLEEETIREVVPDPGQELEA